MDGYLWIKCFNIHLVADCCPSQWVFMPVGLFRGKTEFAVTRDLLRQTGAGGGYLIDKADTARHTALANTFPLPSAPRPTPHGKGTGTSQELTSSSGSSLSSGRELVSSPIRKGVGEHTMSIIAGGSTGM